MPVERRNGRILAAAAPLEEAAGGQTPFPCDSAFSHADITMAAAMRFVAEGHPGVLAPAAALEATEAFRAIRQAFIPPA